MRKSAILCGALTALLLTACVADEYADNSQPEAGITNANDIITEKPEEADVPAETESPAPDEDVIGYDYDPDISNLFYCGLTRASKDGKTGFIDKTGSWVIEPQFDHAYSFYTYGLAIVYTDGKYGCIDMNGNYVFNGFESLAYCFNNDGTIIASEKAEKYGLLDKTGKWVLEPQYRFISYFNEKGIAEAAIVDPDGLEKFGWIDRTGSFVVEPQFDGISSSFSQGLAIVHTNGWFDSRYGYINEDGDIAIEPEFYSALNFEDNGLARISYDGHKMGAIDTKGNIVIDPKYEYIGDFSENGLAFAALSWKDGIGFIDKTGQWVIEPVLSDTTWGFSENGLADAAVRDASENEKWGYIDESGSFVIEPQFDMAYSFNKNDLAMIYMFEGDRNDNIIKYGIINKIGAFIAEPEYDYIDCDAVSGRLPEEELIYVGIDGKYGYIDLSGNEVIEIKYEYLDSFGKNGLAAAIDETGNAGFIDKTGKWVIELRFDRTSKFYDDGYCVIEVDGKYGIIDSEGNYIAEPVFDNIPGI